jgi:hypothetical protein
MKHNKLHDGEIALQKLTKVDPEIYDVSRSIVEYLLLNNRSLTISYADGWKIFPALHARSAQTLLPKSTFFGVR